LRENYTSYTIPGLKVGTSIRGSMEAQQSSENPEYVDKLSPSSEQEHPCISAVCSKDFYKYFLTSNLFVDYLLGVWLTKCL
jgi:hypothetical protein